MLHNFTVVVTVSSVWSRAEIDLEISNCSLVLVLGHSFIFGLGQNCNSVADFGVVHRILV